MSGTSFDPDAPWWVNTVLVVLGTAVPLIVLWISTRRRLDRIADDAKATRSQAENGHAGAEFPNLRDEVTAIRNGVSDLGEEMRTERRERLALSDRFDEHIRNATD